MKKSDPGRKQRSLREILRQRDLRGALIVMSIVLCIHVGFKLLGWGSQNLSWSQVILVAPVAAAIYRAFARSFRKFAGEDAAPQQ